MLYDLLNLSFNLVEVVRFEPTHPKERIYSPPRLSNFAAPPLFSFAKNSLHLLKVADLHANERINDHNSRGV